MIQYPATKMYYYDTLAATTTAKVTPTTGFTIHNVTVTRSGTAGDVTFYCGGSSTTTEALRIFDATFDAGGLVSVDALFYCPSAVTVTSASRVWVGVLGTPSNTIGTATPSIVVSATSTPFSGDIPFMLAIMLVLFFYAFVYHIYSMISRKS